MISTLLLGLPLLLSPVQEPLTRGEVEKEVDRSLRWLRSQQDVETGSYGSFVDTLAALEALTASHRAYRTADGPFVEQGLAFLLGHRRADGSITDASGTPEATRHTAAVAALLETLGGPADALDGTRKHLGLTSSAPLFVSTTPREATKASLGLLARTHLTLRSAEGFWDGERGRVYSTAQEIRELSSIAVALKALEAKAAPREASALPAFSPADRAGTTKALVRGAAFLLEQRNAEGLWGFQGQADPGITAMVTTGLLGQPAPRAPEVQQAIETALDWLKSLQKEDGGIHLGQLANYVTSASVMALARTGREEDREAIERAKRFLIGLQADEGEGYESSDRFYGGVGYGGDERPDLSNLQMALEAFHDAGVPSDDEAYRKALAFLERCQNRSESNDLELPDGDARIVSGNDGGSGYAPGDSKAGFVELKDGRKIPRSYGSMTYALLKGYLFAGLPKDDPRVEAAWGWLTEHYTLDVNPGFESSPDPTAAYQGLFYYFTTMAKALDLYGEETITDASGGKHPWRAELCGRLVSMQRQDGSWVNANASRWFEGNPVLATAYGMITLGTALPKER